MIIIYDKIVYRFLNLNIRDWGSNDQILIRRGHVCTPFDSESCFHSIDGDAMTPVAENLVSHNYGNFERKR